MHVQADNMSSIRNSRRPSRGESGISMLEILIALAILGIILIVSVPNLSDLGANQRLVGATEQLYGHLQQARSEAIARSTPVYVNFNTNALTPATWQYGMSSANSLCSLAATTPTTVSACVITVNDGDALFDPGDGSVDTGDLVLMRFPSTDYPDVVMAIAGFSSGNTQFVFDPVRGTATSGQVNLATTTGRSLRVTVSLLGRVAICSPDGSVASYGTC
jgi:type IV fimbrial biogenesis protein FimT